jgi:hypothetical protein
MNVEDSYEGAVRRLNRLAHAGLNLAPPPEPERADRDRMRDLEELAALACDENERLTQELNGARGEIARLQRLTATLQEMLASVQSDEPATANDDSERLSHELVGARGEIERLQQLVTMLRETLSGAQPDEPLSVPKQRGAALYFFAAVILSGAAAVLFVLRPWASHSIPVETGAAALPSAPAVAAAAPSVEPIIPKAEPIIPKAEPIIPKAEPVVPKVAATIPKAEPAKASRRHAPKHHAPKSVAHKQHKHGSVVKSKVESRGDDPLGGLNM